MSLSSLKAIILRFPPPDSKFVRRLNTFFPGTIISMKFFFDGEYLTQIMQGVH